MGSLSDNSAAGPPALRTARTSGSDRRGIRQGAGPDGGRTIAADARRDRRRIRICRCRCRSMTLPVTSPDPTPSRRSSCHNTGSVRSRDNLGHNSHENCRRRGRNKERGHHIRDVHRGRLEVSPPGRAATPLPRNHRQPFRPESRFRRPEGLHPGASAEAAPSEASAASAEPASANTRTSASKASSAAATLGLGNIRDKKSACCENTQSQESFVHRHPPLRCPAHFTARANYYERGTL